MAAAPHCTMSGKSTRIAPTSPLRSLISDTSEHRDLSPRSRHSIVRQCVMGSDELLHGVMVDLATLAMEREKRFVMREYTRCWGFGGGGERGGCTERAHVYVSVCVCVGGEGESLVYGNQKLMLIASCD